MSLQPYLTPSGKVLANKLKIYCRIDYNETGFQLPSIHSLPPFFTWVKDLAEFSDFINITRSSLQPNPTTQAVQTQHWTRLILSYARHKQLFTLKLEDCESQGSDWDEILRNDKISRAYASILNKLKSSKPQTGKVLPSHLTVLMASLASQNLAVYEPPKQTRSIIVYWRLPEEWAEVMHEWVHSLTLKDHRKFDKFVCRRLPRAN